MIFPLNLLKKLKIFDFGYPGLHRAINAQYLNAGGPSTRNR